MNIHPVYISKHNLNHKENYYFNDFKWRTMALSCSKKIICIIKRNNVKYVGDFCCLNCLHSFRTTSKLELRKKVCENKDFCGVVMPSEDKDIGA